MGLTMVSKTFNFVNAADGQADCITTDTNGEIIPGCGLEK
jgi:hypothetical protein